MGSTVAGAVAGGIAGLAAGYALSKVLEGDRHEATPHAASPDQDTGFTAFDSPPERPDFGAFDGGGGSWDNADSDGGDSAGGNSGGW